MTTATTSSWMTGSCWKSRRACSLCPFPPCWTPASAPRAPTSYTYSPLTGSLTGGASRRRPTTPRRRRWPTTLCSAWRSSGPASARPCFSGRLAARRRTAGSSGAQTAAMGRSLPRSLMACWRCPSASQMFRGCTVAGTAPSLARESTQWLCQAHFALTEWRWTLGWRPGSRWQTPSSKACWEGCSTSGLRPARPDLPSLIGGAQGFDREWRAKAKTLPWSQNYTSRGKIKLLLPP
mmetsp:Transcript_1847/g.5373  ORF Transcript_1847/g.5373 Transcript_1847/m.5373 type:complete len:236 (+) Transcript_1847:1506-2213(+)